MLAVCDLFAQLTCAAYSMPLCRLDRRFWCLNKKQFMELQGELPDAWRLGLIPNDFQEKFPYPQETYEKHGPNLYQVQFVSTLMVCVVSRVHGHAPVHSILALFSRIIQSCMLG